MIEQPNTANTPEWEPYPDLQAMWGRAKSERMWFFSRYQQLWFSPSEIRNHWKIGRFRWGAVNWELRDPKQYLKHFDEKITEIQQERDSVLSRMVKEEFNV